VECPGGNNLPDTPQGSILVVFSNECPSSPSGPPAIVAASRFVDWSAMRIGADSIRVQLHGAPNPTPPNASGNPAAP
jgi:hypothetical protein